MLFLFRFDGKLLQWLCHSVIRDCGYTVLLIFTHDPKMHLNKYLLFVCARLLNSGVTFSFCKMVNDYYISLRQCICIYLGPISLLIN